MVSIPGDPSAAIIRDPLVVAPNVTVLDVIAQMSHLVAHRTPIQGTESALAQGLRAHCAVIVDQQQVVGIFTEQDVVDLMAQQPPLQGVTIGQVITRPVIHLTEAAFTDLWVATQRLQQHQIRHLPIVDGQGALVGVVTHESLLQATPHQPLQSAPIAWPKAEAQRSEPRYASAEQDVQGQNTGHVGTITESAEDKRRTIERQQSERALEQSIDRLQAIIKAIPDLIVRVNRAGIFQEFLASPNFRILGNLSDWVGTPIAERWQPLIAQQRLAAIDEALATRTIQVCKQDFVIEGNTQTEEVRVVPYGEDEVLMLVRDISETARLEAERKQTESALAASATHQRALISALPDLILRVNRAGIYLEFVTTPDFPVVGGLAELVGTHVSESLPPPVAGQRLAMIEQALQTRTIQLYEQDLSTQGNIQVEEVRVVPYSQDEVLLLVRDISDRKQVEAALQNLIQGTAAMTGRDFFPALVGHIAETLDVSYALVTEQVDNELRTLGFWHNDTLQPTYGYALAHTPCERVLQGGEFYCESSVQEMFPQDRDLVDMEAESYLGIALRGSAGNVIGHLCILDQQPIPDHQQAAQILRVFAARAAAELERQRATTALEQLNQALEAKVAERTLALQASEAQVRAMIGAIPDLLLRVQSDGTCLESVYPVHSSHQFLPIRHHIAEALPPDLLQQQLEKIGRAIASHQMHVYEHQFQKHHRQVHEEVRIAPIGPDEALIIVRDVSDRKQAEVALQAKTEELDRFFALALDLLCIVDGEGQFIRLSHQWEKTLGYPLAEMQGSRFIDYVHPEDVDSTLAASSQLTENKALFNFANRYRCHDGSYRWLEWQSVLSHGLIYATARDITTRKHVEAELHAKTNEIQQAYQDLKAAQLQLVQSEKMSSLGQLVAGIAHEINNPVSFIYGNLTVALTYIQDLKTVLDLYQIHWAAPPNEITDFMETADINYVLEDFPKLLKSMENGAVRIRDIVASLRTFSRLDQSDLKATDIHENIDSALVILQNRLNGRAGKPAINVVKQYGDLPVIECYSGLLNQVFMNLLVNAIDAIEERQSESSPDYGGCITLETQLKPPGQVEITIKDNGAGMNAETQAHIFDPFFTTKPVGLGTGMGLSISYQIVTGNHQGQLSCHSVLGEGTEFRLTLWQFLHLSSQNLSSQSEA